MTFSRTDAEELQPALPMAAIGVAPERTCAVTSSAPLAEKEFMMIASPSAAGLKIF